MVQVLIFTGAWFVMTPDQLVDNTYIFGLIGSYEIVKGNADWVLLGAAVLSVLNILVWWPKAAKQTVAAAEANTKSVEAEKDPVVPKMD